MTTLHGDCRDTLKTIPAGSVQCVVTSPPYWGLRRYLPAGHPDAHREIGQEKSPAEYVATMVGVFREVRRVLHDTGTVWLNLGDSYAANRGGTSMPAETLAGGVSGRGDTVAKRGRESDYIAHRDPASHGLKHKDLCMIPWRVALAMQDDGWYVRSVICWAKKSCMPESVTDRPTNSWEPIFLLAKSASYFYDAFAVREPAISEGPRGGSLLSDTPYELGARGKELWKGERALDWAQNGRNQRNVWHLGPEPFSDAHFATFPSAIPKRAIMAGTSERGCCPVCFAPWVRVVESKPAIVKSPASEYGNGAGRNDGNRSQLVGAESRTTGWCATCICDVSPNPITIPCTVLDPFLGSGTVAKVAQDLGRSWIGCELNEGYTEMQKRRTAQLGLIL